MNVISAICGLCPFPPKRGEGALAEVGRRTKHIKKQFSELVGPGKFVNQDTLVAD